MLDNYRIISWILEINVVFKPNLYVTDFLTSLDVKEKEYNFTRPVIALAIIMIKCR